MRRWPIAVLGGLLAVCHAGAQWETGAMGSVLADTASADTFMLDSVWADTVSVDTFMLDSVWVDTVLADTGWAADSPLTVRDVFRQMPDSLMPYLSVNNRLDFIDFMDSGMKAEVTNQMGGTSQMTALTDDSLSIRMNESMRVDILLLHLDEVVDSTHEVVVFTETFLVDSLYGNSEVKVYSPDWQPITRKIPWNEAQSRRIRQMGMQNILKWESDKLNIR